MENEGGLWKSEIKLDEGAQSEGTGEFARSSFRLSEAVVDCGHGEEEDQEKDKAEEAGQPQTRDKEKGGAWEVGGEEACSEEESDAQEEESAGKEHECGDGRV